MTLNIPDLARLMIDDAVKAALLEDWGRAGDITTQATIPGDARARAAIASRKEGRLAGTGFVESACRLTDPAIRVELLAHDGDVLQPGTAVARLSGPARSILACERAGLNYLGHLSGIATATSLFVARVAHTKASIVCTRKTTPGLRAFEKYAVRCGGGANHRFGLDDAVLIKDNHIAVAGGVVRAIERAKAHAGHMVKIEVEVDTLEQLREAMSAAPDAVLLDNMGPESLRSAVDIVAGRALTEASGGIELGTVAAIAEAGVDLISTGWITHSAPVLDLGLDIEID
ncbi:nicotinate-nucleotide pyrophosphorylase [carboxylating] [Breoghania corrubedonensis]|uniref:Probable nicotinate-nucleotide pyrophosphorylase [carboxylating] n=1 Tax=Breoghania corrubedonensis TaxID=665038 RepID=A0A2T5VEL9_9HYPH|nr:carboxylating nicotinate-nucleotide diphosphorylase [Breoghania corrubedonensis]PTW62204.1 nicotinate-nucleotide pyrophosphorylase [carboxylating] [Breoghania corrubedonensis]